MIFHRPLEFFTATATFQGTATSIGCIKPFTGISRRHGPEIAQFQSIPCVSFAAPVFITKGLQFPVQPDKIMDSESLMASGLFFRPPGSLEGTCVKRHRHPASGCEFPINDCRHGWAMGYALAVVVLLAGCHSQKPSTGPTIQFTKIPPAAQGGRERVDTIAGRVTGSQPGQQIVIYARSGPWWVQPWPDKPFIPIQADSTWGTSTHLGFEYAAMLVDPGYHPPPTMDVAPTQGGSVVAVSIVKGTGAPQLAPIKPLHFSGYDWEVRTISADRGGMNNLYDADNAWTDASGALHLRITKKGDRWSCAELELTRSLGYGTYIVVVRDTTRLEPAAVLSLNTFDDWGGDQHYRELDIEFGRWGDAASKSNAQYGLQPF